jgi:membrane-associated protein
MALIQWFVDLFLHLDTHLDALAQSLGVWVYVILFLVIFCETGLVITPILPGDSLLFAAGALAATGTVLNVPLLLVLLTVAAVAGDAVNYLAGWYIGPRVFTSEHSRLLNKKHLLRTHQFYEKYGGKTIIIARFMPIIRTFAPFVAGIGEMEYRHFSLYNVTGGIAWVSTFLLGGYFLGNMTGVKENFHIIIVAIIVISVAPAVIEFLLARRRRRLARGAEGLSSLPLETPVPVESE